MLDLFNSTVLVGRRLSSPSSRSSRCPLALQGRRAQPGVDRHRPQGKTSADLSTQRPSAASSSSRPQQASILDLSSRRIEVTVTDAPAKNGIKLSIQGVAIVKVGSTDEAIRAAAQRFNMQQSEIAAQTTEVLSGALRSIVGNLTVEDIIKDRMLFASQVAEPPSRS
jgi:flotillin